MDNKKTKVIDVTKSQFAVDWADSETCQKLPDGSIVKIGTVLLINNYIAYLSFYTKDQLQELKKIVSEAVDHELSKRN